MKLEKELALQAKKLGICEEWFDEILTTKDKAALVQIYVRGLDFCLSNDYPTNEYIRTHFAGVMEAFGVHLDESLQIMNEKVVVALGKCLGRIETNMFNVSEIYIKNESDLLVVAKGNSFVMIDMFDNSRLHVVASANAKVCVNHYGGEIKKDQQENAIIKVIEKHKKTY